MSKYSYEFKLEVVRYYIATNGSRRSVGAYFSISLEHVRKWVDIYNLFGEDGLKDNPSKAQYTFELKKRTVLAVIEDGSSIREAMKASQLKSSALVCSWLRLYKDHGIDGLRPKPKGRPNNMPKPKAPKSVLTKADREKTQQELLEELAYLRAEIAFLKKRRALIQKQKEQEKAEQQRLQASYLN